MPGAKWSQTYKCWHIPLKETVCRKAIEQLKEYGEPDVEPLRMYLAKRKNVAATQVKEKDLVLTQTQVNVYNKISDANLAEPGRI